MNSVQKMICRLRQLNQVHSDNNIFTLNEYRILNDIISQLCTQSDKAPLELDSSCALLLYMCAYTQTMEPLKTARP